MSLQEPIEEVIQDGEITSSSTMRVEEYSDRGTSRAIPESVLAKIDALAKPSEVVEEEPGEGTDAEAVDAASAAKPPPKMADDGGPLEEEEPPVVEKVEAKPDDPPPVEDPTIPLKAEAERLAEVNRKLVAEIEAVRTAPRAVPEHLSKLSKAAESYLDDDTAALRAFIAHSIGVDDPTHKDVDAELEYLYTSLTARSLGVTPDPNHLALRENARTRQLLARQKRERQAEGQESVEQATAKQTQQAAEFIGNRLQSKSGDYPLTMALAETIDGRKPGELIWSTIQRESKAGRFDKETLADDDKLIAAAAKIVESHYQSIAERIGKASASNTDKSTPTKQPSTVTPSATKEAPNANESSAKSAQPATPSSKARTLTNDDASVAPATTAKKAAPAERPKFKTDAERRAWALRHLPDR